LSATQDGSSFLHAPAPALQEAMRPSHPAHHRPCSAAPLAAACPKTLSGNLEGAQPNDIRVVSGSFRCNGTAWPANLTSSTGTYVVGGAVCGARVAEGGGVGCARV
jgi:hypothetical protein